MGSTLSLSTEPCRSNARVPSGGICSSVLDISFHRIKALAAISSPSSGKQHCIYPRDINGGWEWKEGERDIDREKEREIDIEWGLRVVRKAGGEGGGFKKKGARLEACRAQEDGSGWARVGGWKRWLLWMFEDSGGKCRWWESESRIEGGGQGTRYVRVNKTATFPSTCRARLSRWNPNSWVFLYMQHLGNPP